MLYTGMKSFPNAMAKWWPVRTILGCARHSLRALPQAELQYSAKILPLSSAYIFSKVSM